MSTAEQRPVLAPAERVRAAVPRHVVAALAAVGVLLAMLAGADTAWRMSASASALAVEDHLVTATLTPDAPRTAGRFSAPTAVATWLYPAGVRHRERLVPAPAGMDHTQLWVDGGGRRTAGPPDALAITAGVALSVLRTLLLAALAVGSLLAALTVSSRRRQRAAADAQWHSLVHRIWEDL